MLDIEFIQPWEGGIVEMLCLVERQAAEIFELENFAGYISMPGYFADQLICSDLWDHIYLCCKCDCILYYVDIEE